MSVLLNIFLPNYHIFAIIPMFLILVYANIIKRKGKIKLPIIIHVVLGLLVFIGVILKHNYLNDYVLCVIMSYFIRLCIDDLLTGEIVLGEILDFIGLILSSTILYNILIGCSCIAKYAAISIVLFLLLVVVNEFFNSESSIGGADIYILSNIAILNVVYFMAMRERGVSAFLISEYFMLILGSVFTNFFSYFVIYVIIMRIKRKSIKGIRCLPIFILPMLVTVLALFHVVN